MVGFNQGYTRTSPTYTIQPVAITSVDLNERIAVGHTVYSTEIQIDIGHHVGAIQVTPAVGEQWYVENIKGIFRLKNKIPFNTDDILNPPVEGQVQIGSKGPLELNGAQVNVNGPLRVSAKSTSQRPSAVTLDPGTMIFDTTLSKPIWSDGTVWRDANGDTV